MVVEILVLRLFFPAKTSVDLPWEVVSGTCDRLGTVTQCQKKHKWHIFSDLWIRMSMFTVQNKWDRCGFFTRDIWSLKSSHKVGTHKILLLYSRIFPFLIWILYWCRASKWDTLRLRETAVRLHGAHSNNEIATTTYLVCCVYDIVCVRGNMDSIAIGVTGTSHIARRQIWIHTLKIMNSYTRRPMNSYIYMNSYPPGDLSFHAYEFVCIRWYI